MVYSRLVSLHARPGTPTDLFSIFAYAAPILFVIVFSLWKVIKRTKFVRYQEADLTSGLQEVEDHEESVRFAKEAHNIYADEKPSAWKKAYKWAF